MKRTIFLLIAAVMVAGLGAGCEEKFTQRRFDTMVMNGQSEMEIEKILGQPDARWTRKWKWINLDKDFSAVVLFNENGQVIGKAWSDSARQDPDPEKQWRSGDWPTDSDGDGNSQTTPGDTSTTTIEIIAP